MIDLQWNDTVDGVLIPEPIPHVYGRCKSELKKEDDEMVGKNKPGPKPRQRREGVKLMMLPVECSNEEMQALLELLDAKVGTNNNRKRYEWLRDLVQKA